MNVFAALKNKSQGASKQKAPGAEQVAHNRRSTDKPLTEAVVRRMYDRPRSFCDKLPWLEYLDDSQCFLLEDVRSVGAVLDVVPVGTEGRSEEYLRGVRDGIERAMQDSFEQYDDRDGPWIVQFYAYDQNGLDYYVEQLKNYVWPRARGSKFTNEFLGVMESHLRGAAKPGGLFSDPLTGGMWGGKSRRIHIVVYRRWPEKFNHPGGLTPEQELNDTLARFTAALAQAGVRCKRMDAKGFYDWMLPWFNPRPAFTDGDINQLRKIAPYSDAAAASEEVAPFGEDFAESLLFNWPRTDLRTQTWWFDGLPHRCLMTQKLRSAPKMGHFTGERMMGDACYALWDKMPEGTVLALTVRILPQDILENHLNTMDRRSVGETAESAQTRRDVEEAKSLLASGHYLFKAVLAVYVRGEDLKSLRQRSNEVSTLLQSNGIMPIREQDELCGLDAYLLNLPMVYDPSLDSDTGYTRFFYAQHLANLSPIFGRSTGTGNPGFSFWNRGGSPLCFDPLNMSDRKKNGHMLIFGPTGAGKSAMLVYLVAMVMAIVRARVFIVEAGNSFGLLSDYCSDLGMTVNKVALKPGADVRIPPFADAYKLLSDEDLLKAKTPEDFGDVENLDVLADALSANDHEGDEQRDLMGEMEIIAMLMITGGDEREAEKFDRADRRIIRDAILAAAKAAVAENRQTMTGDVRAALSAISHDVNLKPERASRAAYMAECIGLFCDGMEGDLFNRPGELWPEVDLTVIDLATYAREGYGGQLAVAYTSIMNRINNLAEKYQHDDRPLIMITDEGHIITTNPLLAPFVVKVVKMWRKLGAWYWVATQNLEDFPNAAKKMLNMIEWWLCLVMPREEVEHVARFRDLTDEQKQMLLSARKEPRKYTEGVVLSSVVEVLFRNVPPSIYLSLAMTEKDEKVDRMRIMREQGVSEVEAARQIAEDLDKKRGLV